MADQKKRIIDLSELSQEVQEGQYILVDSAGGTGKMNLKKIVDDSTTSLTERVTDLETDLTEEENARSAADTELSGRISDLQTALAAEKQAREEADEDIETALDNKAEKDGYYPSLYAGNLASTRKQTDSVPYLMRKTGGDLSRVGERAYETIVGASVGWNQLCRELSSFAGQNATISVSGSEATLTATAGAQTAGYVGMSIFGDTVPVVIGSHKYIMSVNVKTAVSNVRANFSYGNRISVTTNLTSGTWNLIAVIKTNTIPSGQYIQLRVFGTFATGDTVNVSDMQIIDLTAYFGSTIADYLYNLETATAGAGIAKLREWSFFTGKYIPYNAGTLESVEARSHVLRGFNQWDEEWEVGNIYRGGLINDTECIRSKSFSRCLPNTSYYCHCGSATNTYFVRLNYYNEKKEYLEESPWCSNNNFTTPAGAFYFKITTQSNQDAKYGKVYNHDICINLSNPDRNGEYEPYHEYSYPLDSTVTLRGIPKLDSNNDLYYDGDTYASDGTVTRKYGVVDLGTLDWTESSGLWSSSSFANMPTIKAMTCSGYVYAGTFSSNAELLNIADKSIGCHTSATDRIFIKDTSFADAAAFKAAMSGVMLVYELATPTTEQSTPFTNPQICDPDGTEEYVTSNGVPVGHETEYDYDIKGLAEGLIDVPGVPSTNGTYVLKATRTADGLSYNWVTG